MIGFNSYKFLNSLLILVNFPVSSNKNQDLFELPKLSVNKPKWLFHRIKSGLLLVLDSTFLSNLDAFPALSKKYTPSIIKYP